MVNQWLVSALSHLLPASCPLCDNSLDPGKYLCGPCQMALPQLPHPCRQCGLPLPADAPSDYPCGACQQDPPDFAHLIAACQYAPPITHLLTAYKFRQQLHHVRLFAHLIRTAVQSTAQSLPEVIIPVPLHPARQRQRGYNQALEIARLLSRWLNIPLARAALQRRRATAPQSDLDAAARVNNVRGAFVLRRSLPYRHVAVLDDIVTTGNTVNEIARVLKNSGVQQVDVWSIARVADS
jgi:ComF family protein